MKKTILKVAILAIGFALVAVTDTIITNFIIGCLSGIGVCLVDDYLE